jgi:hypothetical protein
MVDDSAPVTEQPPAPPKDPGPTEGSTEWIKVQEVKQRRRENGAGVSFSTGKSIKTFILEITFKEQADDESSGDLPNLFNIHKDFVAKLFEITNGDCHLTPSAKTAKDTTTELTKSPIVNLNAFPTSDRDHRRFFQRRVEPQKNYRRTSVKITHNVLMKESVKDVKAKLWNYLTEKGLWMRNGDLKSVETSAIGWLLGAHPQLVFRPAIETELNRLVSELPIEIREEAVANHGTPGEEHKLPPFFIQAREQGFGFGDGRVTTLALTVTCVTDRARLMKELLSSVEDDDLPYMFIPYGMPTMEAQEHYKKAIIKNNDKQNAVQGLSVRGFSQELFNKKMDPNDNNSMTVENYFFTSSAISSIENTFNTDENGRYIFIVLKSSYHEVRAFLQDFCSNKFKEIYSTQEGRDDYRVQYKGLPHLQMSPNAGGAVAKLTERIIKKLDDEERTTGVPTTTNQPTTWASRVVPRFSFDKNSPHPNAQKKTNQAAPTTNTKTSTTTAANANDTVSLNSGSTIANGPSGQTVVSQDLSSVVSQLQSQATEQSRMFKEMMDKQDKRDRRAARVQKQMMTMILTMMQNTQGFQQTNMTRKKTKKPRKSNTGKKFTDLNNMEYDVEQDITSADDELGSAAGNRYGDQGEYGPYFDEGDMDSNMDTSSWGDDDQEEIGQDEDEESTSGDDDESGSNSDHSSDSSDDDGSSKTTATKNTPKEQPSNTSANPAPEHQDINTTEENTTNTQKTEANNYTEGQTNATSRTTEIKPPLPLRQRKRPTKSNLSKEEALAHTQEKIEASLQKRLERDERKRQMGIPLDMTITTSDDETMNTPPKARSRMRSPGNTPTNENKMQRTGKAPTPPSTQEELARILDYKSTAKEAQVPEPTGIRRRRGKQEK